MIRGTKEWAEVNKNCILGCSNDCKYCYAKKMAIRFNRRTDDNWHVMEFNPNSVKQIKKEHGRIMFPTSHDLHIEHVNWWMPFLKGLLEKGNDILIVSKPQLPVIELICKTFPKYKNQIEFRFTIGTDDDNTRKFWEPGAPIIQERIRALKLAYESGYKTSVSMEPLLTHAPEKLINEISPFITNTIWIGIMNHMPIGNFEDDQKKWYYDMKSISSYENMERIYDIYKTDNKIQWKDSVRELLSQ